MTKHAVRIAGQIYRCMTYGCTAQGAYLDTTPEWTEETRDWFVCQIDRELRGSSSPPLSGGEIVYICLMMDSEFMVPVLKSNHGFRGLPSIAAISHEPFHPLYSKVKRAFEFAQQRRSLAGLSPDPWPMSFEVDRHRQDRRLVWEPNMAEIREAWKMYHRFVREGFRPFAVDSQGDPLLPVSSFDPQAGEILFRSGD